MPRDKISLALSISGAVVLLVLSRYFGVHRHSDFETETGISVTVKCSYVFLLRLKAEDQDHCFC